MRPNNFDLLRLIASISVVVLHVIYRLDITPSKLIVDFFRYIPGVPIFFFISGFLISLSYAKSLSIKKYIKNRILRIYPALYICLILSIVSVIYVGYLDIWIMGTKEFWLWIMAQISFIQFYNPEFLREYGVGSLNGSLWTISVELQFYFLVPILYKFLTIENKNKILVSLILFFAILNILFQNFNNIEFREQNILFKLLFVSFIPWFYMFLIGILFQENFEKLKVLSKMSSVKKLVYILGFLTIYSFFGMNPLTFFLFAIAIFILVYSGVGLSKKLLKENDYSYGIYIYHAVVINYFIYFNYTKEFKYLIYIVVISFIFAFVSWHIIEKPMLNFKDKK